MTGVHVHIAARDIYVGPLAALIACATAVAIVGILSHTILASVRAIGGRG
jgi:hypothetical protein